jgi:hypothetical protein
MWWGGKEGNNRKGSDGEDEATKLGLGALWGRVSNSAPIVQQASSG